MSRTFRLAEAGFREVRRSIAWRLVFVITVAGGGGIWLARGHLSDPATYVAAFAFVLVGWYSYIRNVARQRASWLGYELVLDDDSLTQRIPGYAPRMLPLATLRSVRRLPSGDFVLLGDAGRLEVSRHLVGGEDLLQNLLARTGSGPGGQS